MIFGEAAELIASSLDGAVALHRVETLEEAVSLARRLARPGDSVVLSPACSSYDQFANYRERGVAFRRLVAAMTAESEASGEGQA